MLHEQEPVAAIKICSISVATPNQVEGSLQERCHLIQSAKIYFLIADENARDSFWLTINEIIGISC